MSPDPPPLRFNPLLIGFDCPACGASSPAASLAAVCPACGKPLVARYDLARLAATKRRDALAGAGMWRYLDVLPLAPESVTVRLGEGGTPLVPLPALARELRLAALTIKDEAGNATQSFKARGLALAVNAAAAMGKPAIALPSAGNAGSAAAAYAAAAGLPCRIAVPEVTDEAFLIEQRAFGAEVALVSGTIADAGRKIAEWAQAPGWWNVATFKEPYRLEGKKTLGYEIAEQLGWRFPDVILYPTGGGTGLVGMWRAFAELRALGWVADPPPRLVAVQASGCAPVVRAFDQSAARITPWQDACTLALGLQVPSPFADELILAAVRESRGTAIAVSEDDLLLGMIDLAALGVFACPEGGATLAALRMLRQSGWVAAGERVVIYNTGSGLKYLEAWRRALALKAARREVEA